MSGARLSAPLRRRLWWLLPAPAAAVLSLCYRFWPGAADWYQQTVYPLLAAPFASFSGLFPFSLAECFIVGCVAAIPGYLLYCLFLALRRSGGVRRRLLHFVLTLADLAAVLYLLFMLLCGAGYHATSFAGREGFETRPASGEELAALCNDLVARAAAVSTEVKRDENGVMQLESFADTAQRARGVMRSLGEKYPALDLDYPRAKPVFFSRAMSMANITGVYSPYTVEANVNRDICGYEIPAVICHELSHLSGLMREEEANFIAYLAGCESREADFAYSSLMLALAYSTNALYAADYEAYVAVMQQYTEGMRADVLAQRAYWKQFEGPVAEVATSVNNGYLKANAQQDGVKSYGRMVDLLLAEYRQKQAAS